jgi:hypothetical protein
MMIERPNTPRTSYSPKHLIIYTRARMRERIRKLRQYSPYTTYVLLDERQTTTYSLVIHDISETSWCVRITKTLDWERTKGEASVDGLMGLQAFGIKLAGLVYLI